MGQAGLPSYSTGTTSMSSELARKFHIIQPVLVKKNMRWRACSVHVEMEQLELLERDAAVAMNDRLRKPGGARREQDEQRMRERHLLELESVAARDRRPASASAQNIERGVSGVRSSRIEVRQVHHVRQRRQPLDDLADLAALVEQLAAVAVAVDAENEPGAAAASSGPARRARRNPDRSSTTRRRCSPWRTSRRWLRECWVDRPPRDRRARCRARASRSRAPSPAARTRSTTSTASGRRSDRCTSASSPGRSWRSACCA